MNLLDFLEGDGTPSPDPGTPNAGKLARLKARAAERERALAAQFAPVPGLDATGPQGQRFGLPGGAPLAPPTLRPGSPLEVVGRAGARGLAQTRGSMGHVAEAVGNTLGSPDLVERGRYLQAEAGADQFLNPASVPETRDIGSLRDALTFGGEKLTEGLISMAPSLAVGAAGSMMGLPVAGAAALAAVPNFALNFGDVRGELQEVGQDEGITGGKLDALAATGAVPITLLDTLGELPFLRGLSGAAKTGLIRAFLRGAASEGVTEGAQEGVQYAFTRWVADNPEYPLELRELARRSWEGGVAGALPGGVVGAATGTGRARRAASPVLDALDTEYVPRDAQGPGETVVDVPVGNLPPAPGGPGLPPGGVAGLLPGQTLTQQEGEARELDTYRDRALQMQRDAELASWQQRAAQLQQEAQARDAQLYDTPSPMGALLRGADAELLAGQQRAQAERDRVAAVERKAQEEQALRDALTRFHASFARPEDAGVASGRGAPAGEPEQPNVPLSAFGAMLRPRLDEAPSAAPTTEAEVFDDAINDRTFQDWRARRQHPLNRNREPAGRYLELSAEDFEKAQQDGGFFAEGGRPILLRAEPDRLLALEAPSAQGSQVIVQFDREALFAPAQAGYARVGSVPWSSVRRVWRFYPGEQAHVLVYDRERPDYDAAQRQLDPAPAVGAGFQLPRSAQQPPLGPLRPYEQLSPKEQNLEARRRTAGVSPLSALLDEQLSMTGAATPAAPTAAAPAPAPAPTAPTVKRPEEEPELYDAFYEEAQGWADTVGELEEQMAELRDGPDDYLKGKAKRQYDALKRERQQAAEALAGVLAKMEADFGPQPDVRAHMRYRMGADPDAEGAPVSAEPPARPAPARPEPAGYGAQLVNVDVARADAEAEARRRPTSPVLSAVESARQARAELERPVFDIRMPEGYPKGTRSRALFVNGKLSLITQDEESAREYVARAERDPAYAAELLAQADRFQRDQQITPPALPEDEGPLEDDEQEYGEEEYDELDDSARMLARAEADGMNVPVVSPDAMPSVPRMVRDEEGRKKRPKGTPKTVENDFEMWIAERNRIMAMYEKAMLPLARRLRDDPGDAEARRQLEAYAARWDADKEVAHFPPPFAFTLRVLGVIDDPQKVPAFIPRDMGAWREHFAGLDDAGLERAIADSRGWSYPQYSPNAALQSEYWIAAQREQDRRRDARLERAGLPAGRDAIDALMVQAEDTATPEGRRAALLLELMRNPGRGELLDILERSGPVTDAELLALAGKWSYHGGPGFEFKGGKRASVVWRRGDEGEVEERVAGPALAAAIRDALGLPPSPDGPPKGGKKKPKPKSPILDAAETDGPTPRAKPAAAPKPERVRKFDAKRGVENHTEAELLAELRRVWTTRFRYEDGTKDKSLVWTRYDDDIAETRVGVTKIGYSADRLQELWNAKIDAIEAELRRRGWTDEALADWTMEVVSDAQAAIAAEKQPKGTWLAPDELAAEDELGDAYEGDQGDATFDVAQEPREPGRLGIVRGGQKRARGGFGSQAWDDDMRRSVRPAGMAERPVVLRSDPGINVKLMSDRALEGMMRAAEEALAVQTTDPREQLQLAEIAEDYAILATERRRRSVQLDRSEPPTAQGELGLEQASREPGARQYEQLLARQRALEGLTAAVRDPETGKVYTGSSHQAAIERAPQGDGSWARLFHAWDRATDDVGFVDRDGVFISRDEAERRFGVLTMEDVRDARRRGRGLAQDDLFGAAPRPEQGDLGLDAPAAGRASLADARRRAQATLDDPKEAFLARHGRATAAYKEALAFLRRDEKVNAEEMGLRRDELGYEATEAAPDGTADLFPAPAPAEPPTAAATARRQLQQFLDANPTLDDPAVRARYEKLKARLATAEEDNGRGTIAPVRTPGTRVEWSDLGSWEDGWGLLGARVFRRPSAQLYEAQEAHLRGLLDHLDVVRYANDAATLRRVVEISKGLTRVAPQNPTVRAFRVAVTDAASARLQQLDRQGRTWEGGPSETMALAPAKRAEEAPAAPAPTRVRPIQYRLPGTRLTWSNAAEFMEVVYNIERQIDRASATYDLLLEAFQNLYWVRDTFFADETDVKALRKLRTVFDTRMRYQSPIGKVVNGNGLRLALEEALDARIKQLEADAGVEQVGRYAGSGPAQPAPTVAVRAARIADEVNAIEQAQGELVGQRVADYGELVTRLMPWAYPDREVLHYLWIDATGTIQEHAAVTSDHPGAVTVDTIEEARVLSRLHVAAGRHAGVLVLAHNHPGGQALPSGADILFTITRQERWAARGLPLAAHLVFTTSAYRELGPDGTMAPRPFGVLDPFAAVRARSDAPSTDYTGDIAIAAHGRPAVVFFNANAQAIAQAPLAASDAATIRATIRANVRAVGAVSAVPVIADPDQLRPLMADLQDWALGSYVPNIVAISKTGEAVADAKELGYRRPPRALGGTRTLRQGGADDGRGTDGVGAGGGPRGEGVPERGDAGAGRAGDGAPSERAAGAVVVAADAPVGPIFYSRLERFIEAAPQAKGPADQWRGLLRNAKNLSQKEVAYVLGAFLDRAAAEGRSLTREELLEAARGNRMVGPTVARGYRNTIADDAEREYQRTLAERNRTANASMNANLEYRRALRTARLPEDTRPREVLEAPPTDKRMTPAVRAAAKAAADAYLAFAEAEREAAQASMAFQRDRRSGRTAYDSYTPMQAEFPEPKHVAKLRSRLDYRRSVRRDHLSDANMRAEEAAERALYDAVAALPPEARAARVPSALNPSDQGYQELIFTKPGLTYESPHFSGVPGYLAHARTLRIIDRAGRRLLFVAEIQSDLMQALRARGKPLTTEEQRDLLRAKREAEVAYEEALNARAELRRQVRVQLEAAGLWRVAESPMIDWGGQGQPYVRFKFDLPAVTDEQRAAVAEQLAAWRLTERGARLSMQLVEAEDAIKEAALRMSEARTAAQRIDAAQGLPREAPLEKTDEWVGMVLKQLLRLAADEGLDGIVLTDSQLIQQTVGGEEGGQGAFYDQIVPKVLTKDVAKSLGVPLPLTETPLHMATPEEWGQETPDDEDGWTAKGSEAQVEARPYKALYFTPEVRRAVRGGMAVLSSVIEPGTKRGRRPSAPADLSLESEDADEADDLTSVDEQFRALLLTRPSTHVNNIIGTGLYVGSVVNLSQPVARGFDYLLSLASGQRSKARIQRQLVAAARRAAAAEIRSPESEVGRRYERQDERRLLPFRSRRLKRFANVVFGALRAQDRLYAERVAARVLAELAQLTGDAMADRHGWDDATRQRAVAQLAEAPTEGMLLVALAEAEIATFNNMRMGPNASAGAVSSSMIGQVDKLGKVGQGVGLVLQSFRRTPGNVIARTLEATPLGLGMAVPEAVRFVRALLGGPETAGDATRLTPDGTDALASQRRLAEKLARTTTASAAHLALGFLLAALGLLVKDRDEWKAKWRNGQRKRINRLQPVGALWALGAEYWAATRQDTTGATTAKLSQQLGTQLASAPLIEAGETVASFKHDPVAAASGFLADRAGSIVPPPVGALARGIDPVERIARGPVDRIRSNLPFVSKGLPAAVDPLGAPRVREGWARFGPLVDPFVDRPRAASSPVMAYLDSLGVSPGEPAPAKWNESSTDYATRVYRRAEQKRAIVNARRESAEFRALPLERQRQLMREALR